MSSRTPIAPVRAWAGMCPRSIVAPSRAIPLLIEVLEPGCATATTRARRSCTEREELGWSQPKRVNLPPSEADTLLLVDRIGQAAEDVAALVDRHGEAE